MLKSLIPNVGTRRIDIKKECLPLIHLIMLKTAAAIGILPNNCKQAQEH